VRIQVEEVDRLKLERPLSNLDKLLEQRHDFIASTEGPEWPSSPGFARPPHP